MRFIRTLLLFACLAGSTAQASPNQAESALLPEDFTVHVRGGSFINRPAPGYEPRVLPTVNLFTGSPGGYIACYSRNERRRV